MFPLLFSSWCWWTTVWRTPTLRSGQPQHLDTCQFWIILICLQTPCFLEQHNSLKFVNTLSVGLTETECTKWILSVQSREAWLADFSSGLRRPISCLDDGSKHLASHPCLHPNLHGVPDYSVPTFILDINLPCLTHTGTLFFSVFFLSG